MWITGKIRKDQRLRKRLLITSADGKGFGQVGEGQASGGGNGAEAASKIVIAGWSGEPFVPSPSCEKPGCSRSAATSCGSEHSEGRMWLGR